ncbi:hypothetical protein [Sinomonas mesophila]|uniref:hypothetical protein n=1 Tax=Sinomonas mesophila TaxID=1531955 RepID=UPI000985C604|nr:hypothetical protein [Sinomonas mesophila]
MATTQTKETATTSQAAKTADADKETTEERPARTGYTITIPSMRSMPAAVGETFEPKHLVWFGGLAVAGAVGILEWPVVAAVGVSSYVAERFARSARK